MPLTRDDRERRLAGELAQARAASDAVFARVAPASLYERPIAERHRLIFYVGHLEAFDANMLRDMIELPAFAPGLDQLFARGIDPVDGDLPSDVPTDWPSAAEVRAYGQRCREVIDASLSGSRTCSPRVLETLIEHRLMHVETLAYLLHQLPTSCLMPAAPRIDGGPPPARRSIVVPAGAATLGRSDGGGWDNERGETVVDVPAFAIDAYPVTHADHLAFVTAGGYQDPAFWTDDDWAWRSSLDLQHPRFWRRRDGRWLLRALTGEVPLPLDHPVHVSHAEARAHARWRRASLPTEAQWHRAAYGSPTAERAFPWGSCLPTADRGNFDLARDDTTAVTAHPAGASAWGVHDLVGNGWEWTSTPFAPLPGFRPDPFYPGYSADFFDGKHFVLKGGSARTASRMLRRSFRNWFQPYYPFVYATFRLVEE